ncbi:Retrovirus-related Pol polyprotein from transposon RE1, partial [Linum perenne]
MAEPEGEVWSRRCGENRRNTRGAFQFETRGLNENFSAPRTQVLFGEDLPSIDKVVQRMIQHERQLYGTNAKGSTSNNLSMAVQAIQPSVNYAAQPGIQRPYRPNFDSRQRPVCTHCKLMGHTEDRCFYKHGFPPGMQPRPFPGSTGSFRARPPFPRPVFRTQGISTTGYRPQANAVVTGQEPGSVQLSQDQFSQLMNMIQSQKPPSTNTHSAAVFTQNTEGKSTKFVLSSTASNSVDWIVDTGASDHVISSMNLFSTHRSIAGTLITLPTGSQVQATHVGTVILSTTLVLEDVLFVPQFTFNLISVSKLTRQLNVKLIFFSASCDIQDIAKEETIGSARLHNGLYHMITRKPVSHIASAQTNPAFDLWHYRLGHISHFKVPLLKSIHSSISTQPHLPCEICHFSRQRRTPFPVSSTVSDSCFQLVHVDIWGPNPHPSYDGYKYFLTIVDDFSRMTWIMFMK